MGGIDAATKQSKKKLAWLGLLTAAGLLVLGLSLVPPIVAPVIVLGVLLLLPGILYLVYRVLLALYVKVR